MSAPFLFYLKPFSILVSQTAQAQKKLPFRQLLKKISSWIYPVTNRAVYYAAVMENTAHW